MLGMKAERGSCTLLGDVVASRGAVDRRALHHTLEEALRAVNATVPAHSALRVTVGDEFQGRYDTVGAALDAALRTRLELLPRIDVRVGIGRGSVEVFDDDRGLEDGPGWWAARAAIVAVAGTSTRAATRSLRTAYALPLTAGDPHEQTRTPEEWAINAALITRDALIGGLDERSLRILRALVRSQATQAEIAELEGISPSAVSQRVRTGGIGAILESHTLLRRLP